MHYFFLALAILLEVVGSAFLNASKGFTKAEPTTVMAICYLSSFYFLSLTLKTLPLGIAYAIWGGLGIVLTTLVSVFVFKQEINFPVIVGIAMIVAGVVVVNYFNKA
ncbi:MAG: QacE family quaternary ammonium compound efflux SMR transporter [Chryseobacterium sp.]|nr:MAG: QacE family quaternary ammonium compound efflux SMR transporter [Chryseobacterium sp.]